MISHLRKVDTKRIHVHAIKKACEALAESRETFMHKLQLHEILLQVGHGVGQLCEPVLQAFEGIGAGRSVARTLRAFAKRAS